MAEIENNEEIKAPSNFIHDFIDEDLADGKYSKVRRKKNFIMQKYSSLPLSRMKYGHLLP